MRTCLRTVDLRPETAEVLSLTRADAVLLDLTGPRSEQERAAARSAVAEFAARLSFAKRPALVRVSDTHGGEMAADVEAAVQPAVAAIVLSGAEAPQDARDADVAIRKHEMARDLAPGSVRLVLEVDSVAGLTGLERMLSAVDRVDALALQVGGLLDDLRVAGQPAAVLDHAFAATAFAARAAGVRWLLAAPGVDPGERARLATRAHEFGAAGVYVATEAEAGGLTSLFTPEPAAIAAARETMAAWQRTRAAGALSTLLGTDGLSEPRIVDRRAARRARALVTLADAIAERERAG